MPDRPVDAELDELIERALREDVGSGDVTTEATVEPGVRGHAEIVAKADGVIAGTAAARAVFQRLQPDVGWDSVEDGRRVRAGDTVASITGEARTLVTGERTALNLLGRMSGIATLTRAFVDAVAGTAARIVDTRKTSPGLRALEKAAVRAGGGENHRSGLYDMVLIKENHVALAGGIEAAVRAARRHAPKDMTLEIEVRDLDELDRALAAGVDRVLLDNMDLDTLRQAVGRARGMGDERPRLEASGNMTLERVRAVAETGVDLISVGALTHSAPTLDLSMLIRTGPRG